MTFRGVVRTPVYMQVAAQIREAILDGRFGPGDSLPTERDLSTQFGVSRASVREALRALQAQGLITAEGRTTRTTVALAAPDALRDALGNLVRLRRISLADLVELRCALEGAAAEKAAREPNHERLAEARDAVNEMSRPDITLSEFYEADVAFHIAMAGSSNNEAIYLVMLAVRDAMAEHLRGALEGLENGRRTLRTLAKQHAQILDAVAGGDGAQAVLLSQYHITHFYERFLSPPANDARRRPGANGAAPV
jgi:GntR family transcriptional repressor for pyruvate dehydrogenase complex